MPSATANHRGRFSIFGPVLFYELIRDGRRSRLLLLRCIYLAILLFVLGFLYLNLFGLRGVLIDLFESRSVPREQLNRFAETFSNTFLLVQFVVAFLLTPAYTAGAIAEEKERRTLEYMLATDLSSREIVLGKLAARLSRLMLILLAGLPVLALTPFWGGVDPQLVLAGFAVTGLTMFSLAGVSLLNSVYARRPIDALMRTYFQAGVFLLLGACVPGLNVGHPFFAVMLVRDSWAGSNAQGFWLAGIVAGYALVHVTIGVICIVVAIGNLRRVGLATAPQILESFRYSQKLPALPPHKWAITTHVVPPLPPTTLPLQTGLPLMTDNPLLWKEMYLEQQFRWERLHPLVGTLLLFLTACTGVLGFMLLLVGLDSDMSPSGPINGWVRVVGTCVVVAILLVQGFYAAATVSREREKQTLDGLLTLPEGREPILFAKWLGTLLSTRRIWWCLAIVWGWGFVTGGLHVLALPLVLLAAVIYSAFMSSLGLYCSVVCRTTLRATLWLFVTTLVLVGTTWLLAFMVDRIYLMLPGPGAQGIKAFVYYGLAPPMPLIVLAFRYDGLWSHADLSSPEMLLGALTGLLIYALAAWALFRAAVWKFRRRG